MTALVEPEAQRSRGTGGRRSEGSPRCQDSDASFCKQTHPRYGNLHPVCKTRGHCVLRGRHAAAASDLEE